MFVRTQTNGSRTYLLIVDNQWVDGKVKQRVLFRLGRLDELLASGRLDSLIQSLARFSEKLAVLGAHARGDSITTRSARVGPALIFQRLWQACLIDKVLTALLEGRRFEFSVERAIFLTVLHRLFAPGSDRAAEKWKDDYAIDGVGDLELHQIYRAMAWLGEVLPKDQQDGATPFAPRTNKDLIEEALFARRRDLFSDLDIVFFDTTSIYFEGQGGETIGRRAERRVRARGLQRNGRVIFANSGAEAVEAALKTAAIHTKRPGVIAFEGAYHGLTYGALDTTWRAHFRSPFSKQLGHFTAHVPFGRVPNVANIEKFGAVIVEPIQGRGGIVVPPDDFLPKLRRFCDDHGLVLIFDEIYSGFCRMGRWFACEHWGVTPDVVCVGKAMAGGFPTPADFFHHLLWDSRAFPRAFRRERFGPFPPSLRSFTPPLVGKGQHHL